ncbi:Uncharacterized protein SCF082_LOCUS16994 [Durusdinium trenchii]|uniref:Uncharacterized protein n=1 Tax=Durusdinium trenchii TaxID=1381693 RepID=A0ABP0KEJ9_9DINO
MDVDPKSDEEGCSFQSLSLTELASSQRTSFTDVFSETKETVARFASRASRRAQFRRVGFGSPASVVREREVWRPGRADACARMAQVFAVIGCLASRAQELDWLVGTGLNGTASRRKLERRVDLWREEQLLRREMETGDVSKSAAAAPVDASYVEAMKQDLRESFESLLEDKVQTLQLSLQQRLGDTGEELSQLLQVHAASMGERLRICEERIAALAFGALQAPSEAADSEPKEEQRRPGSTGSGASNAGGASLESRVARLERNVKGLAAFASTSDAQRMDDLAMTVKQAQLDSRRCTERIQQLEAHAHQASQPDSQLLQMIKDLEQRIREEMQELKQEVENKISSEEKMDRGILEEVHRDLLSPVAPSSKSLGLGGFDLDFPAKPQTPSTAEVASLHTKMQVMAEQQDDRALHLDQELKKLQQQLFEVQVGTATTATGGDSTAVGDNGSKAASALAGTLAKHEEELKNLSASVSALQASVGQVRPILVRPSQDEAGRRVEADSPGDATSLTLALQKAEEAQRRVASLQTEVSRLAEAVEALRAEAKLSDQDREQLRVPEGLDKETLQDVRDDLLGLDTKEEKPENEVPDVADVADAADAELVKPQASSGEKPALEKPTEPAAVRRPAR